MVLRCTQIDMEGALTRVTCSGVPLPCFPAKKDINWWALRFQNVKRKELGVTLSPSAKVRPQQSLYLSSPGVWCSPLDTPAHGFMMGVGRQFGDIVRFACQQGHRLFGEQELVCGPQGAWSNNPPACHRVWCDPPVLGSGVGLPQTQSQGSHPHRSILMLECREGHRARGDLRITCQANGRWSRPEGACHSKREKTNT